MSSSHLSKVSGIPGRCHLTEKELKQLLSATAINRHSGRNRTMILCTHLAGMRVGEVAALRYCDVLDANGDVRAEVHLAPAQTKGHKGRTVFFPERLRKVLAIYIGAFKPKHAAAPLFYTQKRAGFDANTLCQLFFDLYRQAGLNGASSHSGRRTFITTLANKGIGVRVLQSLAGHRNIGTTQAYIDVNDAMKRAAVELV